MLEFCRILNWQSKFQSNTVWSFVANVDTEEVRATNEETQHGGVFLSFFFFFFSSFLVLFFLSIQIPIGLSARMEAR